MLFVFKFESCFNSRTQLKINTYIFIPKLKIFVLTIDFYQSNFEKT